MTTNSLNVGDAVEDMARCMILADMAAACLNVDSMMAGMGLESDMSDEVLERARIEEPGLAEMAAELAVMAAVDADPICIGFNACRESDAILQDWHIYLDQVVQYCAMYAHWEKEGLVIPDNVVSKWVSLWWHPLQTLRSEIARLIRNRAGTPKMYPAGKVPANA